MKAGVLIVVIECNKAILKYLITKLSHLFRTTRSRSSSIPSMYKTDDDMWARSTIETWVIKAEKGEQNCCPKCDGKVFEAEKMVTASVRIC